MTARIETLSKTMRLTCDCKGCEATQIVTLFYREHEIDYDGDGLTQEKIEHVAPAYGWTCVLDENTEELLTYCPEHKHPVTLSDIIDLIAEGCSQSKILDLFGNGNLTNLRTTVNDVVESIRHNNIYGHEVLIEEENVDGSILISTNMGAVSIYLGDWKEPVLRFIGTENAHTLAEMAMETI